MAFNYFHVNNLLVRQRSAIGTLEIKYIYKFIYEFSEKNPLVYPLTDSNRYFKLLSFDGTRISYFNTVEMLLKMVDNGDALESSTGPFLLIIDTIDKN